jgi:acetyl-CoA carboxylase carboxyl transferase subunit alpha
MITTTGNAIALALDDLRNFDGSRLRQQRRQKFLNIGRKLA